MAFLFGEITCYVSWGIKTNHKNRRVSPSEKSRDRINKQRQVFFFRNSYFIYIVTQRKIRHLKLIFISSVSSYYIFEYYSTKRKKQPYRGNNSSVFHTFILLFLKVSFFLRYIGSCKSFRFRHKNNFWFPFFLQACHVQRSLHPPSFDHQTNIW